MLTNKQAIFHIKRHSMSNVYLSADEFMDIMDNLSVAEAKLYMTLKNAVLLNPSVDYFHPTNLAKELNFSVSTINNAKSGLKNKGYAVLNKFKDENGRYMIRVVVGKEQVILYNLGLMVEISDAKKYKQALTKFPILDPDLSQKEREKLVEECNAFYKDNS